MATTSRADNHTMVLKHGETFAVFDRSGDIQSLGRNEQGLYHAGTRFLSRQELRLENTRPLLLHAAIQAENALLTIDLTNPDIAVRAERFLPHDMLHILRSKFLWQGHCYERIEFRSFALEAVELTFSCQFAADFADVFEVRGTTRSRTGRLLPGVVEAGSIVLTYEGLDGRRRRTRIESVPPPNDISPTEMRFVIQLQPHQLVTCFLTISCELEQPSPRLTYDTALRESNSALQRLKNHACEISSSNPAFNEWLHRASADLYMMITQTPEGPYPYAGIPWFSTPFGRDGVITALELLWVQPEVARGVLAYLAATQALEVMPERDAEPGKILHEARQGEMATLGEVPFGRYYGSVDATPLFVLLAGEYYQRTGDRTFINTIWPSLELALAWMDTYGDVDGDGFVEYARQAVQGLANQGWKDSQDAVFHADGTLAEGPIALCEVQGYVYAAKRQAAELAAGLGLTARAEQLARQAQTLQEQFIHTFWCDDLGTYALALDGHKRPCRVRTSNAGQALFTGIASPAHAQRLAQTLFSEESFSGWGIRTVAASERRYNPMSYHNGSIWPHDNALIALGLARYGYKEQALRILTGLFDACLFMELYRLPELFCGFSRRSGEGPIPYPVACAPQAWASATVFMLLQACLGLSFQPATPRICFASPLLPALLQQVHITNLDLDGNTLDLDLHYHPQDVGTRITRRIGNVEMVIIK